MANSVWVLDIWHRPRQCGDRGRRELDQAQLNRKVTQPACRLFDWIVVRTCAFVCIFVILTGSNACVRLPVAPRRTNVWNLNNACALWIIFLLRGQERVQRRNFHFRTHQSERVKYRNLSSEEINWRSIMSMKLIMANIPVMHTTNTIEQVDELNSIWMSLVRNLSKNDQNDQRRPMQQIWKRLFCIIRITSGDMFNQQQHLNCSHLFSSPTSLTDCTDWN